MDQKSETEKEFSLNDSKYVCSPVKSSKIDELEN